MGTSQLPAVNYFLIIHWQRMNNDRCQGKQNDFLPLVSLRKKSGNLSTPAYSVAKHRQHLWRTISLLINAMNAGNKYIVNKLFRFGK